MRSVPEERRPETEEWRPEASAPEEPGPGTPQPPDSRHRPNPGRATPVSTYRLQLHEGFTFDDAAGHAAYLADLGVSHLYLSPILQSVPGSRHGYDVLDHTRIDESRGGQEGFDRLVEAAREAGLGIIVDVVPNHMAMPSPVHLNAPLWSLLREGRASPYAAWFDVDWDLDDDRILLPVLTTSADEALARGDLRLVADAGPTGAEWSIRYDGNEFPVRPGTEHLPLPELLEAQAYRLAGWREADEGLNYRRFFDVTSLVAVRVEDPVVLAATHALLFALLGHGAVDGLRIDHPDGLADPAGYLEALAAASGGAWVVVEKILEGGEELRDDWSTAGTTGYDAMLAIQQVLTSGAGADVLDRLWAERAGDALVLDDVVVAAKALVVDDVQAAEVDRLMRIVRRVLPGEGIAPLRRGLEALLIGMGRYRAYLSAAGDNDPAEYEVLAEAEARALELVHAEDHEAVRTIAQLARGGRLPQAPVDSRSDQQEFMVRFQQTCGPVMAKGVEDTAFYRWLRFAGANEVGGDPARISRPVAAFHACAASRLARWPVTLTGLTTHDTKRSEDVRARLMTLASDAAGWERWVRAASSLLADALRGGRSGAGDLDPATEYLVWQTLVGTWPITADGLGAYLLKAVREAKTHTAWVDGDPDYEGAVTRVTDAVASDPAIGAHVEAWLTGHAGSIRSNVLSQKLVQLTMPGVADVYQGAERQVLTLVDPDNRRPVDYAERARRLRALDAGHEPVDLDDEKLLVTATALRLRLEHPEWFVGEDACYLPIDAGDERVLAFGRGEGGVVRVVTVALLRGAEVPDVAGIPLTATRGTQMPDALGVSLALPAGAWRNLLCGNVVEVPGNAGSADVAGASRPGRGEGTLEDLLGGWPVALLVRAES